MWGVKMGKIEFNLFIITSMLIIALFGLVNVVSAGDVTIESYPCSEPQYLYDLASDNLTFFVDNYSSVTKRFYVADKSGIAEDQIADNFSSSIKRFGTTTVLDSDQNTLPDNYTDLSIPGPGKYIMTWSAWNGSDPNPLKCTPLTNDTTVLVKLPINGSINQTFPTYQYQARFKFNISSNSSTPDILNWKFSDGTTYQQPTDNPANGLNAFNHTFPYTSPSTPWTYDVNVTATNSTDSIIYPMNYSTYSFVMYPPPVSDFNITDNYTHVLIDKGPAPLKADLNYKSWTFDATPAIQLIPEWNISNSSGYEINTSENFTHIFEKPGVYTVTLKTNTSYGWNQTSLPLLVYDNITSNFTPYQYSCAAFPVNVTFRDNSSGSNLDNITWIYDDGTEDINLSQNWVNHTYYLPGRYNVTQIGWNNTFGIWNQSSQWVNVTGLYANFTWDPSVPPTIDRDSSAVFNFTDTSSGVDQYTRWEWHFSPDHMAPTRNASYSYSRNGTYNVSLTVYDPRCYGSDPTKGNTTTKQVTVYENLVADISYSPKCGTFPLSVQFMDNSTDDPNDWYWTFYYLNGSYKNVYHQSNPVFEYPQAGTYQVDLQATNPQLNWSVKHLSINLTDCLQANFAANQTKGYYPFTVNFTDNSTPQSLVSSRSWNFGDQTSLGSGSSVIHTFNQKGNYNVTLSVTDTSGLTKVANKTIEVGSPVYANFTPNGTSVVPVNGSMVVKFTDLSAPQADITNWDWNFDDIQPNDTNKSPYHQFTSEGWHNVTLNVSNPYYGAWNVSRSRINISVQKAPEASFTVTPDIANRFERVTFVDTSKGESINGWYWQFGDGNTSIGTPAVNYYQNAGTYTVNLTVTNPYGNGTASNVVRVKGPVYADFVTDPSGEWGIVNQPITFIDTSKGQPIHWIWNFGDGNSTTTDSSSIVHAYSTEGSYTVNMTGTNWDGQSGSAVKTILIENKSRPKDVNFGAAGKKYSGTHPFTVQFEDYTPNQSNVTEWYWDFGDRTNSFNTTPIAPSHTYVNPGEYTVTLSVKNDMGVNEKSRVAYVVVV